MADAPSARLSTELTGLIADWKRVGNNTGLTTQLQILQTKCLIWILKELEDQERGKAMDI